MRPILGGDADKVSHCVGNYLLRVSTGVRMVESGMLGILVLNFRLITRVVKTEGHECSCRK